MPSRQHYRNPAQRTYEDTVRFMTWEQFPAIFEKQITHYAHLPATGIYKQVKPQVRDFKEALLETTGRAFTFSGIGSLIDYEKYGHNIKRPVPQLAGTACGSGTLCLEPQCFGFTEGVMENNNLLRNMCWELSMPCLKDQYYSDAQFENKTRRYFAMFMAQGPAALQAYQRTSLLQEAIKVICTDTNIKYTGSFIGGDSGVTLPFYINPTDPMAFPNTSDLPAGVAIGGANMLAFVNFLAPRLFAGAMENGMADVAVYGLMQDMNVAKEQTASVSDTKDNALATAIYGNSLSSMFGDFTHDAMFPTFYVDGSGNIRLTTQEILEPATIAGYVQTQNPDHMLNSIRGLLLVPKTWQYQLVTPPRDDFSSLGLGEGLNFRTHTPGVFPLMSSSMFSENTIGEDGRVIVGISPNGMMSAQGLARRSEPIAEAVRTELLLTYTNGSCSTPSGQLPNVGRGVVTQNRADGFALKSTMYVASAVRGTARPVLLLFQTDVPRSAIPIVACRVAEVAVSSASALGVVDASPGGITTIVLTMNKAVGSAFVATNTAIYRTGAAGRSYKVTIASVVGNVIVATATDGTTLLPACAGAKDDYGTQATLQKITGTANTTSEIMKYKLDPSGRIFLELFRPVVGHADDYLATVTLETGETISLKLYNTQDAGVVFEFETGPGETCNFATFDCSCLINAQFAWD